MSRTDLLVPFKEKDEAKKLGAKWDSDKKVWYAPDGADISLFRKWLQHTLPIEEILAERNMPALISFEPNESDELVARIDNLEVGFYPDDGCFIIVWGKETGVPCDYSDSECPEEKERHWKNCPVADNCPHEFTQDIQESSTVMSREGSRAELEVKIRGMFKNKDDGIGHRQNWPEPAARLFASLPWQLRNPLSGI